VERDSTLLDRVSRKKKEGSGVFRIPWTEKWGEKENGQKGTLTEQKHALFGKKTDLNLV